MLRHSNDFKFSSYFYALNFESADIQRRVGTSTLIGVLLPGIWFKRSKGVLTVAKGNLHYFARTEELPQNASREEIIKDMIAHFDGRHGGSPDYRWDGSGMWAPQKTFGQVTAAQEELDAYRRNFPTVPPGYTGWYSIQR